MLPVFFFFSFCSSRKAGNCITGHNKVTHFICYIFSGTDVDMFTLDFDSLTSHLESSNCSHDGPLKDQSLPADIQMWIKSK